MKEYRYDKLLNIKTRRRKKIKAYADQNSNPYEPTPYYALETLFKHYAITDFDHIVDFGCGKGRLNFFIHNYYQATVTGVEADQKLFQEAVNNYYRYKDLSQRTDSIFFHCCSAEDYNIKPCDNRFYFFNPFSVQVFAQVVYNILHSAARFSRDIELIMYYAPDEYIRFLEQETAFIWQKDIPLPRLSYWDPCERFVIYRLKEQD